jgi:2-polyprenyl-3-methyl-5-hydroxy-6-metoxy-1,4-benzoquinol methylase
MSFLHKSVVSVLWKMNTYSKRSLSYSSIISSLINDSEKGIILDIGTGTGQMANTLCKDGRGFISARDNRVWNYPQIL